MTYRTFCMYPRCLSILGFWFISSLAYGEAPKPEAVAEYHAAQQAMGDLQNSYAQLQALAAQKDADPAKGKALVAELATLNARMNTHLDNAIAAGHAVAMYQKAKLLFAKKPVKNDQAMCELYGRAAEQGLMAGALEYAKCVSAFPPSEEYSKRMTILQAAMEGEDPYLPEYPLLTSFPYCFPKHKPPIQPGEDPLQWITDNARPLALSAEEFRAEGYYTLAMNYDQPKASGAQFLRSAFAHGCREDSGRIAKHLGVEVPSVSAGALPLVQ